jgi:hypothetical protein
MDLRQMILDKQDIPANKAVVVPEWGCTVYVRTLTGTERDSYEQQLIVNRKVRGRTVRDTDLTNARAKLLVLTLCDDVGVPIFKEEDAVALGEKNAAILDRIYAVAAELNGFTDKDIEELTGN